MIDIQPLATTTDPHDHVDTLYRAAALLRKTAGCLRACHTKPDDPNDWGDDHDVRAAYDTEIATAGALELAAESYIVLQTDFDDLLAALVALVQEKQPLGIEREEYQTALALTIKHHDTAAAAEARSAT